MIDLTDLRCAEATPRLLDWGSTLTPVLGGVSQRLSRRGARFAIDFQLPPMHIEAEGRRTIALLQMAKQQGARLSFPQVGFDVGAPGAPIVDGAVVGGTTLSITGATPRYPIKIGQAFNVEKAGRSPIYFAAAQTILDGDGAGEVLLTTMLRTALVGGETINIAKPVIEGWVDGDEFGWTLAVSRTVGLSLSVTERA